MTNQAFKIDVTGIETDIDEKEVCRAYEGISFSPEKRGAPLVAEYIQSLQALAQHIEKAAKDERQQAIAQEVFDHLRRSYRAKTKSWIAAKSRCISSMITGPANFPVRRAEKANNSEHKRLAELIEFEKNMKNYASKKLDRVFTTQEKQGDEIEQLKKKIESAETLQAFMKDANKIHRSGDMDKLRALFVALYKDEARAETAYQAFLKPNYMNAIGFERWQLSNNLANIKRMKERLAMLEKKATIAAQEQEAGGPEPVKELAGLQIVENFTEDRLQLLFDGKPPEEVRAVLKSHGFRWSPRFSAWQRQLTNNARYTLKNFVLTNEHFAQYQTK